MFCVALDEIYAGADSHSIFPCVMHTPFAPPFGMTSHDVFIGIVNADLKDPRYRSPAS